MFQFRFARKLSTQRRLLLEAHDYGEVKLHPVLDEQINRLGKLNIQPIESRSERELWRKCVKVVSPLIIRTALSMLLASLALVFSLIATRNALTMNLSLSVTVLLCCTFLAAELTKNVVYYFDLQRRSQLARGIQLYLFGEVNSKFLTFDRNAHPEFTTGHLKTLVVADVESVEDFITSAAASWVPASITLLVTAPTIVIFAGWVGVVGILISLCQVPVAYAIARKLEQYKRLRQAQQDRLTTVVGEWLRNARLVRYLGWESAVATRIKGVVKDLTLASTRTRALVLIAYGLTFSWWMLPVTGMLLATRFAGAPINASEFFPAIWFLGLLSNHIQFLPHSLSQYGQAAAAMSRIKEFLSLDDLSRHLRSSGPALTDSSLGEPIRFHLTQVSLDFGALPALKDLNLSLDLTAKTAIVGEVASGKSTFLRLLTADLSPTSGAIEVEFTNGLRASLWTAEVRDAIRSRTAYIPQEPFLSNATLRDNIDLWGDRSPEDLARAVAASQLQEDIAIFPRGLDEEVGETGINLSGGQKQRVSIARAILSGRPFFVLDDPLSAVDSHTEKKLFHHLVNGTRGFVLASHRLDELVACDRVLVLDNGHVVEDGIPSELLSNPSSRFSKLASAMRSEAA